MKTKEFIALLDALRSEVEESGKSPDPNVSVKLMAAIHDFTPNSPFIEFLRKPAYHERSELLKRIDTVKSYYSLKDSIIKEQKPTVNVW